MMLMFLFRQMQALKRIEHTLRTANEQLEHTQVIYNELQAQVTFRVLLSMNIYQLKFEAISTFHVWLFWHLKASVIFPRNTVNQLGNIQILPVNLTMLKHTQHNTVFLPVLTSGW